MEAKTRIFRFRTPPVLRVVAGPGRGTVWVVQGTHTVGRGPTCDLVLPDPAVSRQHALVCWGPDGTEVVDLGSTNGTYVNGRRVARCRLQDGDRLQLGEVVLEYRERP